MPTYQPAQSAQLEIQMQENVQLVGLATVAVIIVGLFVAIAMRPKRRKTYAS